MNNLSLIQSDPARKKRLEFLRSHREVGFQYPVEFQERLVVEADILQVLCGDPASRKQ
jgi:hypothetical protein